MHTFVQGVAHSGTSLAHTQATLRDANVRGMHAVRRRGSAHACTRPTHAPATLRAPETPPSATAQCCGAGPFDGSAFEALLAALTPLLERTALPGALVTTVDLTHGAAPASALATLAAAVAAAGCRSTLAVHLPAPAAAAAAAALLAPLYAALSLFRPAAAAAADARVWLVAQRFHYSGHGRGEDGSALAAEQARADFGVVAEACAARSCLPNTPQSLLFWCQLGGREEIDRNTEPARAMEMS